MTSQPTAAETQAAYDRRWWTLGVLCLSLLIVFVGNASLNVTLPTLSRVLHATTSQLQWVVAIYSLVFAGLLFSTGALGDRFGRKGALQLGLLVFLIGAGLATLSTAMWQLIACRAVMGAAGALIMPSTLSILINVFPPHERPKAIAIWASFTGAAGAIGPVAAGWLLGHFWYGSVFLVNVPIIVVGPGRRAVSWCPGPATRSRPASTRSAPCCRCSASAPSSTASSKRRQRGGAAGRPSARSRLAVVVLVASLSGSCGSTSPCSTSATSATRPSASAPGGMILVFLGMYGVMFLITQYFQLVLGLNAARRRPAHPADDPDHADRRPVDAPPDRPVRGPPLVAFGMLSWRPGS